MSIKNPTIAEQVLCPLDDTAAAPSIQFGGPSNANSGTGIFGDINNIHFAVNGAVVGTVTSSGFPGGGPQILALTSNASVGGSASEVMTVPGLLSTDTILAVTQSVQGAAGVGLLAYNTLTNDHLTIEFDSDPSTGAVVVVAVKR